MLDRTLKDDFLLPAIIGILEIFQYITVITRKYLRET